MRAIVIAAIAAVAGPAAADAPGPVALPGWLAGCWIEDKAPAWTEECWTVPRAGMMIGSGRSGTGERLRSWETMQILLEPAAGAPTLAFWGAPRGEGRTRFGGAADGGGGVTFVNAAHDYPQRIRYWREGEALLAETALADGTKARRWRYRRM